MKKLKLDAISYETGSWRYIPKSKSELGTQIDLLADRADGIITLFEIKNYMKEFTIDKAYARNLANKIDVFEKHFKTNKQVELAMITTMGVKTNIWSADLINQQVVLEDLFK